MMQKDFTISFVMTERFYNDAFYTAKHFLSNKIDSIAFKMSFPSKMLLEKT
jgi:hypothetical protein